jgi:hypothetical protein
MLLYEVRDKLEFLEELRSYVLVTRIFVLGAYLSPIVSEPISLKLN